MPSAVETSAARASAPVELGPLVQAATIAGLSYLQHIVTMPAGERPAADPGDPAEAPPTTVGGGFHDRVHGDILVFHRSQGTGGADA